MDSFKEKQHERALDIAKAVAVVVASRPNYGTEDITECIQAVYQTVRELDQKSSD